MKKWLIFILAFLNILTVSCDRSDSSSPHPITPPSVDKPEPKVPEPEIKEPQEDIIREYSPDFYPLRATMYGIKRSDIDIVNDNLKFQQGIVKNWGESRDAEHVPSIFLSIWNEEKIIYLDKTEGEVKGIEKLEIIRKKMLDRCPVLSRAEHNAPVEIHWDQTELETGGKYKAVGIFLTEDVEYLPELKYKPIFNGGMFSSLRQVIWIYGKQKNWSYPNQTTEESGNSWGIDRTFVHEWGHHLAYAIDVNLGRTSISTWEFTESFAEAIRYTCFGSHLDLPEILETTYKNSIESQYVRDLEKKTLVSPWEDPYSGMEYDLHSMELCIAHEKFHNKFDPNNFATTLIEAYKRVKGKKLKPNPYPLKFKDMGYAHAPWVGSGFSENKRLINNQPLQATRAEFLQRFLEIYDCGLANELIKADIEGKLKFEW